MMAKEESRRQYLSIKAREPNGGVCEVQISFERMQVVGKRSMGHASEAAFVMPTVLQSPTAVFEGLRRDEDEDRHGFGWRCYCGRPDRAYRSDGSQRLPFPGQVFLVFVNDEGVAYNWRWENADPNDPELPVDHSSRFQRRLELK